MADQEPVEFRNLTLNTWFSFSLYLESGLVADMDKPGRQQFKKVSGRRYEDANGDTHTIGSTKARTWEV